MGKKCKIFLKKHCKKFAELEFCRKFAGRKQNSNIKQNKTKMKSFISTAWWWRYSRLD